MPQRLEVPSQRHNKINENVEFEPSETTIIIDSLISTSIDESTPQPSDANPEELHLILISI